MADPAAYPSELVRDVTLADGRRVRVRPIRADDAGRLVELYDRLSRHTAYQRFFTIMKRLPPDWATLLASVDYQRRLALVAEAETPDGIQIIAVARYEPTERADTVEVAFVVQDNWQGHGLGRRLLDDLLAAAEARGHPRFCAWVLGDNYRMLDLLTRFTRVESRTFESGVAEIIFARRRE
ncbi:MAG: GNAT family N-acetyltransferase [Candidatus Rokubacteria bacterium]|nr:GNAT family N-acetyltransferase [Candidatus Rokubacteria bacterium]